VTLQAFRGLHIFAKISHTRFSANGQAAKAFLRVSVQSRADYLRGAAAPTPEE
jgi:hypothetical protein